MSDNVIAGSSLPVHETGAPLDHFDGVALDLVPLTATLNMIGIHPLVPAGAIETIWSGAIPYVYPSAATVITVTSTLAADTFPAGTGMIAVALRGLDANRARISEVVFMNGAGGVDTAQEFLRFNEAALFLAGSGEFNAGRISFEIGGLLVGDMLPDRGITRQGSYSLPPNEKLVLHVANIASDKNDSVGLYITGRFSLDGGTTFGRGRVGPLTRSFQGTSGVGRPFTSNITLPYMDFSVEGENSGAGTASIAALISGIIYDFGL